ncbi:sulfatase [Colwellia piezophila]|uniref:sulfatase n=1 Tax=Colwellia piezophila TaxID=211668 RepID=UPI0009FD59BB|nr:sulfatase [Colwellia piezophila]
MHIPPYSSTRKIFSTLFLLLLLPFVSLAKQPYNVLFISVDDMNDWPSPFGGHPQAITPNMEKLAQQGVVFNRAYTPATVCGPSRSAIMTGFLPSKSGVYGNSNNLKHSEVTKDVATMPQYFSQHGYQTISRGKIFHKHGKDHGQWAWDVWQKATGGGGPKGEKPLNGLKAVKGKSQKLQKEFDWGATSGPDEKTKDMATALWFADQLTQDFDKPFFMGVGISKPHLPWYVPQKYFDMYPLETIQVPDYLPSDLSDILTTDGKEKHKPHHNFLRVKEAGLFKETTRAYLANISYVDDSIGVILDALAKSPYADNTIVVVWGDHGWYLGEKLQFGKTKLWEESARVPLLIKVPNAIAKNVKTDALVSLQDLYPTLVELAGLPEKKDIDGKSFAPLFSKPDQEWHEPILTTMGYKNHSVRSDQYRYIRWEDGTEELYDHNKDSKEWSNLSAAAEYKSVIAQHKALLPKKDHLLISVPVTLGKALYSFTSPDYKKVTCKNCDIKDNQQAIRAYLPNKSGAAKLTFPLNLAQFTQSAFTMKIKFDQTKAFPDGPIQINTSITVDGYETRAVKVFVEATTDWQEVRFDFGVPLEKLHTDYLLKSFKQLQAISIQLAGKHRYIDGDIQIKEAGLYQSL